MIHRTCYDPMHSATQLHRNRGMEPPKGWKIKTALKGGSSLFHQGRIFKVFGSVAISRMQAGERESGEQAIHQHDYG